MLGSSHKVPEAVGPAEALMHEVGVALREARRDRGKEILDVAEILRIQPTYLAALEQGDLSVIPGRTYALGFLRSYADYLGFDGDDVIGQIRSSVGLAGGAALQGRVPLTESRLPKIPILIVSLAALAGAYAGWAYFDGGKAPTELVEEVPDELRDEARSLFEAGLQAAPPAPPASEPAEAADRLPPPTAARIEHAAGPSEGTEVAPPSPPEAPLATPDALPRAEPHTSLPPLADPAETAPAVQAATLGTAVAPQADRGSQAAPAVQVPAMAVAPEANLAGEAVSAVAAPAIAAAPDVDLAGEAVLAARGPAPIYRTVLAPPAQPEVDPPARSPRVYGTELPQSRVVLRARGSAWVHVSSTNNDYLWVQTLRPGDRFIVPARPDLVLWTGNAGGVEVLVDGALLPPLGPDALVVRDVSLQPRALLRRLLPLPEESAGVSDLASAAKPPMMPPSSR